MDILYKYGQHFLDKQYTRKSLFKWKFLLILNQIHHKPTLFPTVTQSSIILCGPEFSITLIFPELNCKGYKATKKLCFPFFCCNAAIRTTRGSPYVCMSLLAFLPFTQKIFRQPIPQNLWSYAIFSCGCPYEKKNVKSFVYEGVQHFLDTKYKIIFLL